MKVTLSSRTTPQQLSDKGVSVGLGNGWDSVLTIGSSGLTDRDLNNKTITMSGETSTLTIQSELKKSSTATAGPISGSAVISLTMD